MDSKAESNDGAKRTRQQKADDTNDRGFKVDGKDLLEKVKALIKEGNIRRIVIKNESGETLVIIPLTIGVIGAALAPLLAIVGVIAALVGKCVIVVEKK